jgi:signal transduction histidine kinase
VVTLEASKLFDQLNPAELDSLGRAAQEREFAAGQDIFKEGDAGDGLYLVKDGLVELSGLIGPKKRQVFSEVLPGDMFGEMAVVEDQPRSAGASARERTSVYFLPREKILTLVANSPTLALILLREISQRLRAFDRQYVREVVQAERLTIIGRFARSIVHDLKNPLHIIGLTAELAASDRATPQMRANGKTGILKQVERINDMVGEILEFTQGAPADRWLARMDYAEFVRQVVEDLRPEVALKSAVLEFENPPPAVELQINPKRLCRVFHNLIHNATDFMPGGGKIFLRFRAAASEVVTEIEDTGTGIAPEIAGHLFEAFASYGKTHGTGLGLSISKRIIEDHQGWIAARSEPGRGAVFSFGLPRPSKAA